MPLLVARNVEKLEEARAEIVAGGGTAYVYAADISDMESVERLVERVLADHRNVDMLVNNAGRSIRRSIALSYDRFHDFERTMQLNYFGAVKLIIGLLPHMRERGSGHIVNISSIGVQTNPPRFSAYVASKSALDAFTRVVASEVIGDGITFTTIHMPLVRTPMIAPTKMYDAFPAITPDEAGDMICEAMRGAPQAHGHAPGHRSARSPTRSRPRRSTGCCTWPTACSPTRPPQRARRTKRRRPPSSRSRWRRSPAAFTGSGARSLADCLPRRRDAVLG